MWGMAGLNGWPARSGLAEMALVGASNAPEVPSETNAAPGRIAPMPTAPAGLSPAPPAIIGRLVIPQRSAISLRSGAAGAQPSTRRGIWLRDKPVAESPSSDQSRRATSSHNEPDASEPSSIASPVRIRRRYASGSKTSVVAAKISGSGFATHTSLDPGIPATDLF